MKTHFIKRNLIVMAVVLSIMTGGEIYAGNLFTSTEFDPVLISEKSEIDIGKNTDQEMRKQYRVSTDQRLNRRINNIGQRLAAKSPRKNLNYTFTVLDDELVNAFAAPGGYIYITTGILKRLRNDNEIAGVLAHEIGHLTRQHALKALQRQMIAQFGLQLIASGLGDSGMSRTMILKASEISAGLLLLKNSRENELQADAEGVRIMHLARYNPQAMIDIQTMLLKMSRGSDPPAIISTHPPSRERIEAIRQAIRSLK